MWTTLGLVLPILKAPHSGCPLDGPTTRVLGQLKQIRPTDLGIGPAQRPCLGFRHGEHNRGGDHRGVLRSQDVRAVLGGTVMAKQLQPGRGSGRPRVGRRAPGGIPVISQSAAPRRFRMRWSSPRFHSRPHPPCDRIRCSGWQPRPSDPTSRRRPRRPRSGSLSWQRTVAVAVGPPVHTTDDHDSGHRCGDQSFALLDIASPFPPGGRLRRPLWTNGDLGHPCWKEKAPGRGILARSSDSRRGGRCAVRFRAVRCRVVRRPGRLRSATEFFIAHVPLLSSPSDISVALSAARRPVVVHDT